VHHGFGPVLRERYQWRPIAERGLLGLAASTGIADELVRALEGLRHEGVLPARANWRQLVRGLVPAQVTRVATAFVRGPEAAIAEYVAVVEQRELALSRSRQRILAELLRALSFESTAVLPLFNRLTASYSPAQAEEVRRIIVKPLGFDMRVLLHVIRRIERMNGRRRRRAAARAFRRWAHEWHAVRPRHVVTPTELAEHEIREREMVDVRRGEEEIRRGDEEIREGVLMEERAREGLAFELEPSLMREAEEYERRAGALEEGARDIRRAAEEIGRARELERAAERERVQARELERHARHELHEAREAAARAGIEIERGVGAEEETEEERERRRERRVIVDGREVEGGIASEEEGEHERERRRELRESPVVEAHERLEHARHKHAWWGRERAEIAEREREEGRAEEAHERVAHAHEAEYRRRVRSAHLDERRRALLREMDETRGEVRRMREDPVERHPERIRHLEDLERLHERELQAIADEEAAHAKQAEGETFLEETEEERERGRAIHARERLAQMRREHERWEHERREFAERERAALERAGRVHEQIEHLQAAVFRKKIRLEHIDERRRHLHHEIKRIGREIRELGEDPAIRHVEQTRHLEAMEKLHERELRAIAEEEHALSKGMAEHPRWGDRPHEEGRDVDREREVREPIDFEHDSEDDETGAPPWGWHEAADGVIPFDGFVRNWRRRDLDELREAFDRGNPWERYREIADRRAASMGLDRERRFIRCLREMGCDPEGGGCRIEPEAFRRLAWLCRAYTPEQCARLRAALVDGAGNPLDVFRAIERENEREHRERWNVGFQRYLGEWGRVHAPNPAEQRMAAREVLFDLAPDTGDFDDLGGALGGLFGGDGGGGDGIGGAVAGLAQKGLGALQGALAHSGDMGGMVHRLPGPLSGVAQKALGALQGLGAKPGALPVGVAPDIADRLARALRGWNNSPYGHDVVQGLANIGLMDMATELPAAIRALWPKNWGATPQADPSTWWDSLTRGLGLDADATQVVRDAIDMNGLGGIQQAVAVYQSHIQEPLFARWLQRGRTFKKIHDAAVHTYGSAHDPAKLPADPYKVVSQFMDPAAWSTVRDALQRGAPNAAQIFQHADNMANKRTIANATRDFGTMVQALWARRQAVGWPMPQAPMPQCGETSGPLLYCHAAHPFALKCWDRRPRPLYHLGLPPLDERTFRRLTMIVPELSAHPDGVLREVAGLEGQARDVRGLDVPEREYVMEPGESLLDVADKLVGDARRALELEAANPDYHDGNPRVRVPPSWLGWIDYVVPHHAGTEREIGEETEEEETGAVRKKKRRRRARRAVRGSGSPGMSAAGGAPMGSQGGDGDGGGGGDGGSNVTLNLGAGGEDQGDEGETDDQGAETGAFSGPPAPPPPNPPPGMDPDVWAAAYMSGKRGDTSNLDLYTRSGQAKYTSPFTSASSPQGSVWCPPWSWFTGDGSDTSFASEEVGYAGDDLGFSDDDVGFAGETGHYWDDDGDTGDSARANTTRRTYAVVSGDWPAKIAKKLGADKRPKWWSEMLAANPHKDVDPSTGNWVKLNPGEIINIPDEWPEAPGMRPLPGQAPGAPQIPPVPLPQFPELPGGVVPIPTPQVPPGTIPAGASVSRGTIARIQAELVGWGRLNPGAIRPADWGTPADVLGAGVPTTRTQQAVASYQAWHNQMGRTPRLRTDGALDPDTAQAIDNYTREVLGGALPGEPGLPPAPGSPPGAPHGPPGTSDPWDPLKALQGLLGQFGLPIPGVPGAPAPVPGGPLPAPIPPIPGVPHGMPGMPPAPAPSPSDPFAQLPGLIEQGGKAAQDILGRFGQQPIPEVPPIPHMPIPPRMPPVPPLPKMPAPPVPGVPGFPSGPGVPGMPRPRRTAPPEAPEEPAPPPPKKKPAAKDEAKDEGLAPALLTAGAALLGVIA
jgi:hypothetical protein